jgi:hypothetical protein
MPAILVLLICLLGLPSGAHAARERSGAVRVVTIINHAAQAMTEVHVSSANEDGWGDDLLKGARLEPGRRMPVRVPAGTGCAYDAEIVYQDGHSEERRGVDLCRVRELTFDGRNVVVHNNDAPMRTISLLNRSARQIEQVFVSPANSDDWGEDQLSSGPILPGGRTDVGFVGGCQEDVRIVFDNKSAEERRALDLCSFDTLTITPGWTTAEDHGELDTIVAPAPVPEVPVVNKSGGTVTELYLMHEGSKDEGRDLLGRSVLRAGGRAMVPFDRGAACKIDVHAVFAGNRPDAHQVADLCTAKEIAIAP